MGGTAAGAGNLVKMVVKRAGNLVGKTFSRDVYTQIGRTFNKQFMRRLNVVLTVVLEVGTYVYNSSTWQNDLVRQASKGLDEWKGLGSRLIQVHHITTAASATAEA